MGLLKKFKKLFSDGSSGADGAKGREGQSSVAAQASIEPDGSAAPRFAASAVTISPPDRVHANGHTQTTHTVVSDTDEAFHSALNSPDLPQNTDAEGLGKDSEGLPARPTVTRTSYTAGVPVTLQRTSSSAAPGTSAARLQSSALQQAAGSGAPATGAGTADIYSLNRSTSSKGGTPAPSARSSRSGRYPSSAGGAPSSNSASHPPSSLAASNSTAAHDGQRATPGAAQPHIMDATMNNPALHAKLRNMVFVEAPITMESESPAEPIQQHGYAAAADAMRDALAANMDASRFRVQRIRSVPLLIDTNMNLHAGMAGGGPNILTLGSNNNTLGSSEVPSSPTGSIHGQLQPGFAAAPAGAGMQLPRRRVPRRHASLKHLLQLDSYDFVADVDVALAQEEVDSGDEGSPGPGPTARDEAAAKGLQAAAQLLQQQGAFKASNILAVSKVMPRSMRRSMWSVKDYQLLKKLHQGYASDVFFAKCNHTGENVVLKVYRLADQCDLQRVQLYREIKVHSRLQHQNIVQFYAAFLEENCVVIVQEYAAGGDLLRYMYKNGGRLAERQAVNLVLQPFLSALLYMHNQGIIHRDIKPENCLLTDSKLLKLADFGLAVDLNEERANTRAGTLDYMAPEVLRCPTKQTPDQYKTTPGAAHYQMGADAWAVGVFAYELVVGGPPFKADQMIDTARNIISINITYPSTISEYARDFIASCLRKHPGDRPTVLEMLHHPWIQMFQRRASVRVPPVAAGMRMSGTFAAPNPGELYPPPLPQPGHRQQQQQPVHPQQLALQQQQQLAQQQLAAQQQQLARQQQLALQAQQVALMQQQLLAVQQRRAGAQ